MKEEKGGEGATRFRPLPGEQPLEHAYNEVYHELVRLTSERNDLELERNGGWWALTISLLFNLLLLLLLFFQGGPSCP